MCSSLRGKVKRSPRGFEFIFLPWRTLHIFIIIHQKYFWYILSWTTASQAAILVFGEKSKSLFKIWPKLTLPCLYIHHALCQQHTLLWEWVICQGVFSWAPHYHPCHPNTVADHAHLFMVRLSILSPELQTKRCTTDSKWLHYKMTSVSSRSPRSSLI